MNSKRRARVIVLLFFLGGCTETTSADTAREDPVVPRQPEESILARAIGEIKASGTRPPSRRPAARRVAMEQPSGPTPYPPGFGPVDRYTSHHEACLGVVEAEVPKPWQRAILDWCDHRSYHSSRNGIVKSRVDGSQIHDRDRPTSWSFYKRAVADGTLDPEGCPWHAVDNSIQHPPGCRDLRKDWPFKSPRMTERLGRRWLSHSHDMERFGARGPHDNNANAYRVIRGCWDPQQLERFDVAITATVRAALKICECWGCSSKKDIKAHWGRGERCD